MRGLPVVVVVKQGNPTAWRQMIGSIEEPGVTGATSCSSRGAIDSDKDSLGQQFMHLCQPYTDNQAASAQWDRCSEVKKRSYVKLQVLGSVVHTFSSVVGGPSSDSWSCVVHCSSATTTTRSGATVCLATLARERSRSSVGRLQVGITTATGARHRSFSTLPLVIACPCCGHNASGCWALALGSISDMPIYRGRPGGSSRGRISCGKLLYG